MGKLLRVLEHRLCPQKRLGPGLAPRQAGGARSPPAAHRSLHFKCGAKQPPEARPLPAQPGAARAALASFLGWRAEAPYTAVTGALADEPRSVLAPTEGVPRTQTDSKPVVYCWAQLSGRGVCTVQCEGHDRRAVGAEGAG